MNIVFTQSKLMKTNTNQRKTTNHKTKYEYNISTTKQNQQVCKVSNSIKTIQAKLQNPCACVLDASHVFRRVPIVSQCVYMKKINKINGHVTWRVPYVFRQVPGVSMSHMCQTRIQHPQTHMCQTRIKHPVRCVGTSQIHLLSLLTCLYILLFLPIMSSLAHFFHMMFVLHHILHVDIPCICSSSS